MTGRFFKIADRLAFSETTKISRNYTGSGTATYPNGDKYIGEFKEGVSNRNFSNSRLVETWRGHL